MSEAVRVYSERGATLHRAKMERVEGIEPSWPAWKAGTLPLSYTRINYRIFTTDPPRGQHATCRPLYLEGEGWVGIPILCSASPNFSEERLLKVV